MDFEVGDRIIMKKPHPCGSKEWEVLRVGIDFRIRCCGCDHQIMVPRKLVEKNTKSVNFFIKKCLHFLCRYGKVKNCDVISYPCSPAGGGPETRRR